MPFTPYKQLFLIAFILLLPRLGIAQLHKQSTVDSLVALLFKAPPDTIKVDLMNKISFTYYNIDTKKGIDFGNEGLRLAEQIGWKKGIAKAYNSLGANYWARYEFVRAQDDYGTSLRYAQQIDDKSLIAKDFHDIGMCYDDQNNYSEALAYYLKASLLFGAIGNNDGVLGCSSNMADIYVKQKKYDDALKFYRRSFEISRQIGNKRNVAFFNWRFGAINNLKGRLDEALKYEQLSLRKFKVLNDYEDMVPNMTSLGDLFLQTGNYRQALAIDQGALKAVKKIKASSTKRMEADIYFAIGMAYLRQATHVDNGLYKSAGYSSRTGYLRLAAQNLQISASISTAVGYKENIISSLNNLADVETMQGNFSKALKVYKDYIKYRDSSYNLEKNKLYASHELSFEYAKKRDSLNYISNLRSKEAEKAKTLAANRLKQGALFAVVIIVILLLFMSYFIFRNRLQKESFKSELAKEKSEAKLNQLLFENKLNDLALSSLKSQMKPHFIFNCLNSIKFYIEKNETEAASTYITKFSKLIRNILDSSRLEKISLGKEIELIQLYLEMEAMRLKEKLHYQLEIAENIDVEFVELPPLLVQPYVENAIWHGLMPKEQGGNVKLSIDMSADERYLIISIKDSGIGREKSAELKKKGNFQHRSHGGDLNGERIAIINTKYKASADVMVTDLKDTGNNPSGTLVTIKLLIQ